MIVAGMALAIGCTMGLYLHLPWLLYTLCAMCGSLTGVLTAQKLGPILVMAKAARKIRRARTKASLTESVLRNSGQYSIPDGGDKR